MTRISRRRNASPAQPDNDLFLVKPYLQLGNKPVLSGTESLEIHWHSRSKDEDWKVDFKPQGQTTWTQASEPEGHKIRIDKVVKNSHYVSILENLLPGSLFDYRVHCNGNVVFTAEGMTRKGRGQPHRYVILGDIAEGLEATEKIAYQISLAKPDTILLAGDIAYKNGRFVEYLERFFPAYNADSASPKLGAPHLRSRLIFSTLGNHDVSMPNMSDYPNLNKYADLLSYYFFWSLPLNGPVGAKSKSNLPDIHGEKDRKQAFLDAAGDKFPRMGNYSFDFGDCHWLVLDANGYMDWTDRKLVSWVEADLKAAKDSAWKFVCLHQPPFSSDVKHADEQHMRLLANVFEANNVSVVFGGHYHAYERSYPLAFKLKKQANRKRISSAGTVDGSFVLDKNFNGKNKTKPQGVLYIVTGGGGAKLYLEPSRRADHNNLPPFTSKLVDDIHSFTCCDVNADSLKFSQIDENGNEIDSFTITK